MVIWSEFRLGKYRDDDHQEDASHLNSNISIDDVNWSASVRWPIRSEFRMDRHRIDDHQEDTPQLTPTARYW